MLTRKYLALSILSLMPVFAVFGQEANISVQAVYLAGGNIYLDQGSDAGIQTGDTLRVELKANRTGLWLVNSSSSSRAVVSFLGEPFPVTRGARYAVRFIPRETTTTPMVSPADQPTAEMRTSILSRRKDTYTQRPAKSSPIRISGRVSFDMNALRSKTGASNLGIRDNTRTFSTPSAGVRARISNLPGKLEVQTNIRVSRRINSGNLIQPATLVRVYQASVSRSFQSIRVEAGRFYNPYERFSGYWDGLKVHFGSRGLGGGIIAGFEPSRSDAQFSSEMPKATFFLNYGLRTRAVRYTATASFNQLSPTGDYRDHTFMGWTQSLRVSGFRLSQDVQMDRHPLRHSWILSRMQVRASAPIVNHLQLLGRFSLQQPYSVTNLSRTFGTRRDQANLGLSYFGRGKTAGLNVTSNSYPGSPTSYTYSTYFNIPSTRFFGLGVSGNASYWHRTSFTTWFVSGGLQKTIGKARASLQYSQYQSDTGVLRLVTHSVMASLNLPLSRRIYSSIQMRTQIGKYLTSTSLFTSLSMRL